MRMWVNLEFAEVLQCFCCLSSYSSVPEGQRHYNILFSLMVFCSRPLSDSCFILIINFKYSTWVITVHAFCTFSSPKDTKLSHFWHNDSTAVNFSCGQDHCTTLQVGQYSQAVLKLYPADLALVNISWKNLAEIVQ